MNRRGILVYDRFVCICLLTVAIQVLFYLKSCVVLLISLSTVHVEYCIFWRSQSPSLLLIIFHLMLHFVGSTSCSIFVIICYIPKNSQEIFCTSKWWSSWFIISGIDYFRAWTDSFLRIPIFRIRPLKELNAICDDYCDGSALPIPNLSFNKVSSHLMLNKKEIIKINNRIIWSFFLKNKNKKQSHGTL